MDNVIDAINVSYDSFAPNMLRSEWTILQLETLLDNILLANNDLATYYRNFADILRSM